MAARKKKKTTGKSHAASAKKGSAKQAAKSRIHRTATKKLKSKKAAKPLAKITPQLRPVKRAGHGGARKSFVRRSVQGTMRLAKRLTPALARSPYDTDLDRNPANYQPLTPLTFLERAAKTFPNRTAIVHGKQTFTYAQFYDRARKLASALTKHGVKKNDTVSAMLANTPPMLDAHYGVPMAGAVLNCLNTRLDPAAIAFMLDHSEAKVLITDREFAGTVKQALTLIKKKLLIIDYDDPQFPQTGEKLGEIEYEDFIAQGDAGFAWMLPGDEWDAIALNYTSGTTGNPKGVVFHHRGATLMGYGNILAANLPRHPVYLWTLPMFHCNGWCFPWSLSVVAGTHVCLRWVRAKAMYDSIIENGVTHMCGAPIVMSTLINADPQDRSTIPWRVEFITAAAPPPESVLAGMKEAGFNVTHVYGLTETYGPSVVNEWKSDWDALDKDEQAAKKARQGVRYHALDQLSIKDPETMEHVPADGETLGEVMFRGNIVMKGYLKNPTATKEAFEGGWFHSGDLGVTYPDGYVQLKDRSKDIIISGGENISSIEVEDTLLKHPAVMFAAVVAKDDEKWGETPCAFVELKPGHAATAAELIEYCRQHLARYKCPRHVVFDDIPKTSTGKIQKFKLRERTKTIA
jgi:fatty-acyl-CoA synthase